MPLSDCLSIVTDIRLTDSEQLLDAVDRYIDSGMAPADAQRLAAQDLLAEIEADQAEARDAVRSQHPELFAKPAAPVESKWFGERAPRQARPPGGYRLPDFGAGSQAIEAIQDRYNRWKQVVATVGQQGGVVNELNDFYRAEERYWGKVASRIEDFDREVQDFLEALAEDGVDLRSMQLYAYAKHAKERNAELRTRRAANATSGFDSWSGMTDQDADDILADARAAGLDQVLDRHHTTLMSWTQGTRDVLLLEGLITQDQYLTLNATYSDYVPLRGNAKSDGNRRGTGSGFNIRGKETQRAKGRYSEADNIIEHIIQDRVRALTRAGKNEVLRSFLQFVFDNPDPELWVINDVEVRPVMTVDDQGNQVIEEQRAVVKDDRTIGIKDGGREVFVLLKDETLREQMKNMHVEQVGTVLGHALAAQRMLGRLYTSLNPVFTVLNWARDTQAATIGMVDEVGIKGAARLWGYIPKAMAASFQAEFGTPSADYQLYRATGGKTGFMNFRDIDELAKDLQHRVTQADRSAVDPRVWAPAALELIEKVNAGIENSTRFAAFLASRAEGKTLAESARISKNITVNFNRKGTLTPQLSAFFLFLNPAIQGTARVAQTLRSPKALAVLGAGMAGVAGLALQNASMGDDDDGVAWWDKVPQSVKDRNLVIVLPPVPGTGAAGEPIPGTKNGRYLKIPMPYGWNWFATVANQAVDMWRNVVDPARGATPTRALKNTLTSAIGAYMPVQELGRSVENTKSLALAAVPDFLNAPVQSILNMNAFGRPMYPDGQQERDKADASKYFAGQAGTVFQRTAKALNEGTGGNAYQSGMLDFTPATLENLLRSYGGGPASFSLDLANAMYVHQSIKRPDLDVRRLPFIKQLYGRIDAETDREISSDRMDQIASMVDKAKAAQRNGEHDVALKILKEGGPVAQLGAALETSRDQLGKLRKEELAIIASKESEEVKYARLQAVDARKRQVAQALNRAFNDAARAPQRPQR